MAHMEKVEAELKGRRSKFDSFYDEKAEQLALTTKKLKRRIKWIKAYPGRNDLPGAMR